MGFSEKIFWMQEKALDVVTKNLNGDIMLTQKNISYYF